MSLTPLAIIFILQNQDIQISVFQFIILGNIILAICIGFVALLLSHCYIHFVKKYNQDKQDEEMECNEIEIAEPRYIPIYIAYFVIAISIDNWIVFGVVFILIYLLILKGKFSYFNPYLLFLGYHFYEVSVDVHQSKYAKYKIFLISNQTIKTIKKHGYLIRLNDFVYLDKRSKNE